jgi:hypothetical protein
MGFVVQLVDGPAAGWDYHTLIEPDPEIGVAPLPGRPGQFMRTILEDRPWDGQRRYRQAERERLNDGDILIKYEVVVEP